VLDSRRMFTASKPKRESLRSQFLASSQRLR
jgi:hypothetical protein